MKQLISYSQIFAGSLLLFLFLLPSLVNLHHNLFEHRDLACTSGIDIHFHETELHCDFDDFTWNIQYVEVDFQYQQPFLANDAALLDTYTQPGTTPTFRDLFKRGPPDFS